MKRVASPLALPLFLCICFSMGLSASNHSVYDIGKARELCDSLPLDNIEGIWICPDDNVTVLMLRKKHTPPASLPEYEMTVVESTEANASPGDIIGNLKATSDMKKYDVELFTKKKKGILTNPKKCVATLSSDGEFMRMARSSSSGIRLRFNLNPSYLLPRLWRSIFRISTSGSSEGPSKYEGGMLKIYPSYDGNGSDRRKPRYL